MTITMAAAARTGSQLPLRSQMLGLLKNPRRLPFSAPMAPSRPERLLRCGCAALLLQGRRSPVTGVPGASGSDSC